LDEGMTSDESKKLNYRIAPFVVAILCFAMPFLQVSCSDETLTVTGFQLALGGTAKSTNQNTRQTTPQDIKRQPMFLIALLCAVAAAGAGAMAGRKGKAIQSAAGLGGLVFLLLGKSDLTGDIPAQFRDAMKFHMEIGFMLASILLGVGAVVAWMQWKDENSAALSGAPPGPNLPPIPHHPPPAPPS
jgi:hypothetical protein